MKCYFLLLFCLISSSVIVKGQSSINPKNQSLNYSSLDSRCVFNITTVKESEANQKFTAMAIPVSDFIVINSNSLNTNKFYYKVYNRAGNLIKKEQLYGEETLIDLSKMIPETYFLKITDENKELTTFKIVKH